MDTSRLSKVANFTAGASIFSGRPDPVWMLDEDVAKRLLALWDSMPQYVGSVVTAPPLGYRGCFMQASSGSEWFAFRGVVSLKTPTENIQRRDDDRQFEKEILKAAPTGMIPSQILDAEFQ